MLKSNDPNTGPWGTPKSNSDQLLKLQLTFAICQRFVRYLFINLKDLLVNSYVSNLASKIEFIVSQAFVRFISTAPPYLFLSSTFFHVSIKDDNVCCLV